MGNVQPNYDARQSIGYEGQIYDMRSFDGRSLICEAEAGIAFGRAVIMGAADTGVTIGAGGKFAGLSIRDPALSPSNADKYAEGGNVGVMSRGTMLCKAIVAVAAGDPVYRTATGTLTNVQGNRTAAAVAAEGNTGTGTMGAITVTGAIPNGDYKLTITAASSGAGSFLITDKTGAVIGPVGTVAAAYSFGGLAFTLADGTPDFAVGDSFVITVSGGADLIPNAVWEKTLAQNAIGPVRLGIH